MHTYGHLHASILHLLDGIVLRTERMAVRRRKAARSSKPFPASEDLEVVLMPMLAQLGFEHHRKLSHPRTGEGFEYDFFRSEGGVAMEIMGYRADDEVYKDILKFHIHEQTRVGIFWVPRWKWIKDRKNSTNYRAALKAAAFAEDYINVEGLVVLAYDWEHQKGDPEDVWRLVHIGVEDA